MSDDQNIEDVLANLFDGDSGSATDKLIAGKFAFKQLLGLEGQATVILAREISLNRDVVLKIYHATDQPAKTRLLNEGRAIVGIESRHVVKCLGIEENDDSMILVLEHIVGRTLDHELESKKFSTNEILKLFRQLVKGVEAVHERGLLHLDLKPGNVVVDQDRQCKLIDFGLTHQTETGQSSSAGTPAFMAPEVADSNSPKHVDERTDIFGLGAVLYYMLTKKPPFEGESAESCKRRSRQAEIIPVGEIQPDVPAKVARLCMKCLSRLPHDRFASTKDLANELDANLPRVKRRSKAPLIAAIALGLLVAVFAAIYFRGDVPDKSVAGDASFLELVADKKWDLAKEKLSGLLGKEDRIALAKQQSLEKIMALDPEQQNELCLALMQLNSIKNKLDREGANPSTFPPSDRVEAQRISEVIDRVLVDGIFVLKKNDLMFDVERSNDNSRIDRVADTKDLIAGYSKLLGEYSPDVLRVKYRLIHIYLHNDNAQQAFASIEKIIGTYTNNMQSYPDESKGTVCLLAAKYAAMTSSFQPERALECLDLAGEIFDQLYVSGDTAHRSLPSEYRFSCAYTIGLGWLKTGQQQLNKNEIKNGLDSCDLAIENLKVARNTTNQVRKLLVDTRIAVAHGLFCEHSKEAQQVNVESHKAFAKEYMTYVTGGENANFNAYANKLSANSSTKVEIESELATSARLIGEYDLAITLGERSIDSFEQKVGAIPSGNSVAIKTIVAEIANEAILAVPESKRYRDARRKWAVAAHQDALEIELTDELFEYIDYLVELLPELGEQELADQLMARIETSIEQE